MSRALKRRIAALRAALLTGDAPGAVAQLQDLSAALARERVDGAALDELEAALAELRGLAEASLEGARGAAEEVRAIVLAARQLATYDSRGRRQLAPVAALAPRRF